MTYAFRDDCLLISFVFVCRSVFCLIAALILASGISVLQPFFIKLVSTWQCHKLNGLFLTMMQVQVDNNARLSADTAPDESDFDNHTLSFVGLSHSLFSLLYTTNQGHMTSSQ